MDEHDSLQNRIDECASTHDLVVTIGTARLLVNEHLALQESIKALAERWREDMFVPLPTTQDKIADHCADELLTLLKN